MAANPRRRLGLRYVIASLAAVAALAASAIELAAFATLAPELGGPRLIAFAGIAVGSCAAASLAAWLAATRITRPLEQLRNAAASIAAGDLTARVEMTGTAEVSDLAVSFYAMIEQLQATLADLRESSQALEGGAHDILGSVSRQAAMSAQQAAAINETSTTASEISQTSKQATAHADSVIEMTKRSDELSHEGLQTVEEAVRASASLGEQVNRIAGTMAGLAERTLQVGEIITSVKDLAEQSNLLALNASIEATKAGEHGRGFAVVALEMRNLAEQSRQAAVQIRSILQEIQRSAREASAATDEGSKRASAAMTLSRSAGEAIEGLATVIRESAVAARQIANNTRQQTIGVDQMVVAITELSRAINESADGTRRIESGTVLLTQISKRLAEAVRRYRV